MATVTRTLQIIVNQGGDAATGLGRIVSGLGSVARVAGTAALGGLVALAGGATAVGVAGLSMNDAMEQATAKINAFTKDAGKTAEILDMVRDRAARTPFEFQEMAAAAGALIPSAKQAQVGLESLIEQAEILAASNPAEGLEGAAFALKEAVSGDFTSIIERFNLPRQFINQLKEEGVPSLEIVSRAMAELGFDTDLVTSMANTAQGRWSTFMDTLQGLSAIITQPIFDAFSGGLGNVNDLLAANEPALKAVAEQIGVGIKSGLDFLMELLPGIVAIWNEWSATMSSTVGPAMAIIEDAIGRIAEALGFASEEFSAQDAILATFKATLDAVVIAVKAVAVAFELLARTVEFFKPTIDAFKVAWNGVGPALSGIANSLPDWMVPGSPTPLELGLRGITAAAKDASGALAGSVPTVGGAAAGRGGSLATAGGGGPVQVIVYYNPIVSTASQLELEQALGPAVDALLRKRR